jgi:hypothetical protein
MRPLVWLSSLALSTLLGCTTHTPVELDAVPPSTAVRAEFGLPRDIVVHEASGDSIFVPAVTTVEGTLTDRTPETFTLAIRLARVREASGRTRTMRFSEGALTRIPTQTVERREANVVGTVLLVAATVVALVLIGSAITEDPEPQPQPKPDGSSKST